MKDMIAMPAAAAAPMSAPKSPRRPTRPISADSETDADLPDCVSADGVILEFLKTNRKTEEYLERLGEGGRLKDLPEFTRTLNILPEGPRSKDLLEDLGHKSAQDEERVRRISAPNILLPPMKYCDESRCVEPCIRRMPSRLSLLQLPLPLPLPPIPRQLRDATLKRLKHGLGRLCRRRTVTISEYDPVYKASYLGNVLTGWAKGDGCVEKPLAIIWRNYTSSSKPDVHMKVTITSAGLRAQTKEHGLTEYWSHRITHCAAPSAFPWVFCWVYRHEGRKLKPELRCHAVLCSRPEQARRMAQQVSERLAAALLEFRREKLNRQRARLSLAGALHDSLQPARRVLLATGAANYRPPLDRCKSAPKLGAIEEDADEEEGQVFGRTQSLTAYLHKEEMANLRRHRFGETVRRKMSPTPRSSSVADANADVNAEKDSPSRLCCRSGDTERRSPWTSECSGRQPRLVSSSHYSPRLAAVPEPSDESETSTSSTLSSSATLTAQAPSESGSAPPSPSPSPFPCPSPMGPSGQFVLSSGHPATKHAVDPTEDPVDRDEASSSSSLQSLSSEGSQDHDDEHRRGCCDEDCVSDESGYVEADALSVLAQEAAKAAKATRKLSPQPQVASQPNPRTVTV